MLRQLAAATLLVLYLSAGSSSADFSASQECLARISLLQFEDAATPCTEAATEGDRESQATLGFMYFNGYGVNQSLSEAARWYRQAAIQGDARSQLKLGMPYYEGSGIGQSYEEAARWYQFSAEQGFAEAQFHLGVLHYFGRGVAQQHSEAVRWFTLAAKQRWALAHRALGYLHERGEGVQQSVIKAYMWYFIAEHHIDGEATAVDRDRVTVQMSQSQVADAEALARRCMRSGFNDC